MDRLVVVGARQHNLKNVSISLPRGKLVVFTGPSGSGKSSLAFDTIYAEGQRRYVESLSAYARQFLEQLAKPDVERIDGLSPAIAIEQRPLSKSPRSTVGTVTEIADYLRLLFARVGIPHCPSCGKRIEAQTVQQIVDRILAMPAGTRFMVLAPIARGRKGELKLELQSIREEAGLAYSIFSSLDFLRDGGMFSIHLGVTPDKGRQALALLREELSRIAEKGPDADEVAASVMQLKGSIVMGQESCSSRMYHVARQELYLGTYTPPEKQVERLQAVTREDVAALAAEFLRPGRLALSALGPADGEPLSESDWPLER